MTFYSITLSIWRLQTRVSGVYPPLRQDIPDGSRDRLKTAKLTRAPGNNAPIGGLKVVAASRWFAARPSGTENIYKIYAESFTGEAHLSAIVSEVQAIVSNALLAST